MNLAGIDDTILDHRTKGIPGGTAPFRLRDIARQGWNILREDTNFPVAVLKDSAIAHNSHWMQGFLARSHAVIAPHGKTTMSPQLFARQVEDGAWAITLATPQQIQVARDFGFPRIVLANQLVGRQAIAWVLAELKRDPGFDFYCLVDSAANIAQLAAAAREADIGRPLNVLLEGGTPGGRTGVRDRETGLGIARAVKAAGPHLALRGVEGFEGLLNSPTREETEAKVRAFLDLLIDLARDCERENLFAPGEIILSAGGSAFYDMVVARFVHAGLSHPTRVLIRSGCYLTHDSSRYRRAFADILTRTPGAAQGGGLVPALEVWAYVQSRPEPGKVLLTMGARDTASGDLPVPQTWYRSGMNAPAQIGPGHTVTGMNDQHTHMTVPENSPLAYGDLVSFGVSHPCLTFDKWQVLMLVDDAYNVTGAIRTFF
jgi:D-serine deaminase-like pyridoxal phosphate-dependent protein